VAESGRADDVRRSLLEMCDSAIVLESLYSKNRLSRALHRLIGSIYAAWEGLKFSNYLIGKLEFSPSRIQAAIDGLSFDVVMFEYWHAFKASQYLRDRGMRTVLDMHNILWQAYSRQLEEFYLPNWIRTIMVQRYRVHEEAAWFAFDRLVAINQGEYDYVRECVDRSVVYLPMGIDLQEWQYRWNPVTPRRVAYYGGLGSRHNQQDALLCHREIMPLIWEQYPDTEFWIMGSHPPAFLKELERDPRVHVPGFAENPQDILETVTLLLCPWSGRYGFRSRIIEVMACGVPVVASVDAVYGMGLEPYHGIALGRDWREIAALAVEWLQNVSECGRQSLLARQQVEKLYSIKATYDRFLEILNEIDPIVTKDATPDPAKDTIRADS
jgi:glycosyltransferase involved in cell wall biosynthesis